MTSILPSTTTGGQRCVIHGQYWGTLCPGCNTHAAINTRQPLDSPAMLRIASALERIAVALEGGDAL